MKNTIGNLLTLTIFGESHGPAVGGVIDGMPAGVKIDMDLIAEMMQKRKASGAISTGRHEDDIPEFLSGIKDGVSEGTPIAFLIRNKNVRSGDYNALSSTARPGHADYAGHVKYRGNEDASGGGHFSGRLTSVMVTAGAIALGMLKEKGIAVGTHIESIHGISDRSFGNLDEDISYLHTVHFPVLDEQAGEKMQEAIVRAKEEMNSLGGILDTAAVGIPAGIGEPEFDSLESRLSHAVFSIPAVKGIAFGAGFDFAEMTGAEANDPFRIEDGKVVTSTNHNGGINGGISNGMPIRFKTVIKPTPSIARAQKTVNFETMEETEIEIKGRHDPCIVHRAAVVVDAMTAFTLADVLIERYGSMYFGEER